MLMDILNSFLNAKTVAQTTLLTALVCCAGALLGRIRIAGLPLGVSAVFAAGIIAGCHGVQLDRGAADFILNFGLILFIYTVGLEGGPGFLNALRRDGIRLGGVAVFIILCGWLCCVAIHKITNCGVAVASGVYAGAVTNIPSLAAAQETLKGFEGPGSQGALTASAAAAAGYPFGMFLVILLLYGYARVNGIDFRREERRYLSEGGGEPVSVVNFEITASAPCVGRDIVSVAAECGGVASRFKRGNVVGVPTGAERAEAGDIVLAVVPQRNMERMEQLFGRRSDVDLREEEGINAVRQLVSARGVEGKTIGELAFHSRHGAVITRVNRAGMEFVADLSLRLEYGDTATVVGSPKALAAVCAELGGGREDASRTDVGALFLGVSAGLALGGIAIPVPGLPLPVKLGVAGGCIISGICFGHMRRLLGFNFVMPSATNRILREVGITLFFAIVGIESGFPFVEAVTNGEGLRWMLYSIAVVVLPLLLACVLASRVLKLNYLKVAGVLSGATTNPPALTWASSITTCDAPAASAATVYPLTLLLRIISAQILVMLFYR